MTTRPPSRRGIRGRTKPSHPPDRGTEYPVDEPAGLLAFLLDRYRGRLSRNAVKSLLASGQVAVDGKPTTAYDEPLRPGQVVSVGRKGASGAPPLAGLAILYEDEHLVVVRKDAGLLSISAGRDDEPTAYRQLSAHVKAADPAARIFVVHRLDRETSGVMMFAKSERIQQKLQTEWQTAIRERTYVALVEGVVRKPEGVVSSWLKESRTLRMYSSGRPGDGRHAVTRYRTLRTGGGYSLLEVRLETGRKNQIRVHMQDIGHPIAGDRKYGSRLPGIGRLGLHARVLAFLHPATGQLLRFESDVPPSFYAPFRTNAPS